MDIRYSYREAPTIKRFSESDKFMRGLMGPFGSGKSSGCVIEIVKRAMAQAPGPDGIRRTRWVVVRNTYRQLLDTSVKTFHQWLPPHIFGQWKATDHTYLITEFGGCEIEVLFRALDRPDQVDNLLSLELTGAWVNEAREIPWTIIQALQGRVGRYPSKIQGGCTWYGVFMDTNPPDTESWWYKLFEEKRPENAAIFKQPPGRSALAENASNLPAGYYDNLASGATDPEWVKVYVDGDYGFVVEGKVVYPEYADQMHCSEVRYNPDWPIYRGWDFGLTPACVFTQVTPEGGWNIVDEMTAESLGIDRFSNDVLLYGAREFPNAKYIDIADPAGMQRAQTDEQTCFMILRAKNIDVQPGDQSMQVRIESVRKALSTLNMRRPVLQVSPRCKMLRKGFQGGYHYRRMRTSQERYAEEPEKNVYSHPHDALQYVAGRLFGGMLTRQKRTMPRAEPIVVADSLAGY